MSTIRTLVGLPAIVLFALATPSGETVGAISSDPTLTSIPELALGIAFQSSSCEVTCWDNVTGVHVAPAGGDTNKRGAGPHENPYPGTCAVKHPGCVQSFAFTAPIQEAIENNDVKSLRRMLDAGGEALYLATERNALQIVGCRGDVVGHVSLPASLIDALLIEEK